MFFNSRALQEAGYDNAASLVNEALDEINKIQSRKHDLKLPALHLLTEGIDKAVTSDRLEVSLGPAVDVWKETLRRYKRVRESTIDGLANQVRTINQRLKRVMNASKRVPTPDESKMMVDMQVFCETLRDVLVQNERERRAS